MERQETITSKSNEKGLADQNENAFTSREALEPYGPSGFRGVVGSRYVALCAAFSALGGLLFGYEYGFQSIGP